MQAQANKTLKFLLIAVIALALFGFADATFLTAKRMTGGPIPCVLGFTGCDTVSKSPYAVFFGIPLSAYGMAFYLAAGILAVLYLDTKKFIVARLLMLATLCGFLASAYFVYLQAFVIHAFCVYCIASALSSTALFGVAITIYLKLRKKIV